MKGFILTMVAITLFLIFAPIAFTWQVLRRINKLNDYFFSLAVSIDQFCNVFCSKLLDDVLIKKGGSLFGNTDETVSSVIGKNRASNTLTVIGIGIYNLLNKLEKNHAEKAIESDEINQIK